MITWKSRTPVPERLAIIKIQNASYSKVYDMTDLFETEGLDLPCTAWAGSGLLVKSRLIRIRADEGARERARTFEIALVLAAAGRDIPIKRADRHAINYYVMHKQARWDNADSGSYLIT